MRAVLDLVAPPRCLGCRAPHELPWCPSCLADASAHRLVNACLRCASPAGDGPHGCWSGRAPIVTTTALFRYRGLVADSVVAAKLRGAFAAWEPLGAMLADELSPGASDVHAVTAVPTEPGRRRRRGFDHALLLAAGVARALDIPAVATLIARGGARDQGSAGSLHDRARLPCGTFVARRPYHGAELLIVDDVLTTGATCAAAVSALAAAGASAVHIGVLARAGAHALDGHRGLEGDHT